MRETIKQVADYYFETGKAVILKTDSEVNTINIQAYHGFAIESSRLINIIAMELPSITEPIIGSEQDRSILAGHVEHIGNINYKIPSQLALLSFFCEDENLWYSMDFIQLKEYWTTSNMQTATIRDLEHKGLVSPVRSTVYGPDILNMIDQPFQVIIPKKDWIEEVFG